MFNDVYVLSSAPTVLHEALFPRQGLTDSRQARLYAEARANSMEVFTCLDSLCRECGVKLEYPSWAADGDSQTIMTWCQQLFDQMHSDKIGRITYEGNHATYSWYEVKTRHGILNNSLSRLRATHRILNPRQRRLPIGYDVPAKAKRMLDRIESVEVLRKACRVVDGMLVGEGQQTTAEWTERTMAGKALDSGMAFMRRNAKAIGSGIAGLAGAGLTATGIAALTAVAATDPAIVIADVVFFGWKE